MSLLPRRSFLQTSSALAAAGLAGDALLGSRSLRAEAPSDKLGVAVIGCGGMGAGNPKVGAGQRLVALVDIDDKTLDKARESVKETAKDYQVFHDYRRMFDACHKDIDVVLIATPDHHHAPAAMRAIRLGKAVFIQKPLAHNIAECRALAAACAEHKVLGQMGNQGHYSEGIRRVCETIWAGVIGPVRETHTIFGRNFGGTAKLPAGQNVPPGIHWDEWLGPAPLREYHTGLHPFGWRSWRQFGTGTIGDMACHNIDAVHWALRLADAKSCTIECLAQSPGSAEQFSRDNVIRWSFPARGDQPAVAVHGYDHAELRPAIMQELEKKHGVKFGEGSLFVGEKGFLYSKGSGSQGMTVWPESLLTEATEPPKVLPRSHGGPISDLFYCLKNGGTPCSDIASAAALTSFALTGHLAMFAGPGKQVAWDAEKMQSTSHPEINPFVSREYRKGWEL